MSSAICLRERTEAAPSNRFSSTVKSTKVPRPCGMWARPSSTRRAGCTPANDTPSSSMRPRDGMLPESARSVVVLPAPLAPSSAAIVPSSIEKLIPRRTCSGP